VDREIFIETLRDLARSRWRWVLAAVMTILALAVTLEEIHAGATLFLSAAPGAQWALGAAALGPRAWDPQGLGGSASAGVVSPARFVIARWSALVSVATVLVVITASAEWVIGSALGANLPVDPPWLSVVSQVFETAGVQAVMCALSALIPRAWNLVAFGLLIPVLDFLRFGWMAHSGLAEHGHALRFISTELYELVRPHVSSALVIDLPYIAGADVAGLGMTITVFLWLAMCRIRRRWGSAATLRSWGAIAVSISLIHLGWAANIDFGYRMWPISRHARAARAPVKTLVQWVPISDSIARAKATSKLLMYDFTADWCAPCHRMAEDVFADPAAARWIDEHFVAVQVLERREATEAESEAVNELQQRYKVTGFPTLVVVGTDGLGPHQSVGFSDAQTTRRFLEAALSGRSSN
jgi:thiol-disulfide isomerase/thioredoxin